MTRQEWLDNDFPFYHITPTKNLVNILASGLKNKNGQGICVVRTKDEIVVRYICETMLNVDDNLDFSIIEIKPSNIQLKPEEILNDNVTEVTNCLHNYISRDTILVVEANIVSTYKANLMGIPNLEEYESNLRKIVRLDRLT